MIFDCAAQVADLSTPITLEPGDVIFTGTPSGVAAGMRPPRWLKAGDRVRAEITGIGPIDALIVDEVAEIHAPERRRHAAHGRNKRCCRPTTETRREGNE